MLISLPAFSLDIEKFGIDFYGSACVTDWYQCEKYLEFSGSRALGEEVKQEREERTTFTEEQVPWLALERALPVLESRVLWREQNRFCNNGLPHPLLFSQCENGAPEETTNQFPSPEKLELEPRGWVIHLGGAMPFKAAVTRIPLNIEAGLQRKKNRLTVRNTKGWPM